jgi:DNA ligase 1
MTFDPNIEQGIEPQELVPSPKSGTKRQGIMLCYPFEEKRLEKWNSSVLVQPKLDGERCRALLYNGNCVLLSSSGEVITSVPHINKALLKTGLGNIELDGELYIHGLPFEEIHSRVSRTVNLHSDYQEVCYHIFDIVSDEVQALRLTALMHISFDADCLRVVNTGTATDVEQVLKWMDIFVADGYEGIIVRHPEAPYKRSRSTYIMKFKPRKEDSYKIVGVQEEVDKNGVPKNSLGAFICQDDMGTKFSVGSGFNAVQRKNLWQVRGILIGKKVVVKYQHLTPGRNVPRFPILQKVLL